jgi:hypothetical protein
MQGAGSLATVTAAGRPRHATGTAVAARPSLRTRSGRGTQPTSTFTAAVISLSAFLASAKYMPVFGSV